MKERGNYLLRVLDRYFGIPLVFALGSLRRKKQFLGASKDSKIALLKTAGIGDIVLLTAIIADIRRHLPQAQITLFTGTSNREMGNLIPGIIVQTLPITRPIQCLTILRRQSYDLWLDFGPWPRINALFSHFSRSKIKVGFKSEREFRHYIYDRTIDHSQSRHEIENFRALLQSVRIPTHSSPQLPFLRKILPNRVVIHAFPGGHHPREREWLDANWIELVDQLVKRGYEIFFTGTGDDRPKIGKILSAANGSCKIFNEAGLRSLKETAILLSTAAFIISVDTGIMHMAAALGCPVISLHGPTPPTRWQAIGSHVTTLTCCSSFLTCSHRKQRTSMYHVSVKQVLQALTSIHTIEQRVPKYKNEITPG